jgi:energy-converting hydrogenase Eha subunit A
MKEFTTDWFTSRIPHWEAVVLPNLPKDRPIRKNWQVYVQKIR